jgi:ParB family chromosome partitioning protein
MRQPNSTVALPGRWTKPTAPEHAENEFRKAFTASERAAISKALEREDLKKHQGKKLPQNIGEVSRHERETSSKIAKAAGFRNPETMRQAQTVAERGTPELQAAMDRGEVSISAASKIASQPAADQKQFLEMPKDERREVIRQDSEA